MDQVTDAVRQMYEQFPYPAGNPQNRVGSDVELLLSYVNSRRSGSGPIRVLDAGCGRGLGIIGAATLQPEVQFLGIDLNRVALQEAKESAAARGLKNVQFQECNLMSLEGIEVPPGGFDVIHSSGVLHHLSDPVAGLKRLKEVLAPHGVINMMVYALCGRQPLINVAEAIDLLASDNEQIATKIPLGRTVAALAKNHVLKGTSWENTFQVDDVEFVDRCLNVNETSYDIPMMWQLLEDTGLRFIRWIETADWEIDRILPDGELKNVVLAMPAKDQFHFIELICERPGFELILAQRENEPRKTLEAGDIQSAKFCLHPELVVSTKVRHTPNGIRTEELLLKIRAGNEFPVPQGAFASVVMLLKDRLGPWSGQKLLKDIQLVGLNKADSQEIIIQLVNSEILTWLNK